VYTAYEYLEQRFDLRTRALTSVLFLVSRGLSTGISIYAPSIILSSLLGWNIYLTNMVMGGLLIIYTLTGGSKAVAYTQMQQLFIVFIGMFLAGYVVVQLLPADVDFADAVSIADKMGKMNVIETKLDITHGDWWKDKYNIWSGLIGGFFLALSYFGTDQSQVGRYLTAKNVKESQVGLWMNGLVKVPMQFLILLVGVLVFSFYLFYNAPLFFNEVSLQKTYTSSCIDCKTELTHLQTQWNTLGEDSRKHVYELSNAMHASNNELVQQQTQMLLNIEKQKKELRAKAISLMKKADATADVNDTNYIFLYFVVHHLPKGLIGLLIAVIFLAAWGSIAAALNSLASSTVIDLYKRMWVTQQTETHYYIVSKWVTLFWGIFCIATAMFASQLGSLIEAVNILGSLFYGTMLGIFVVAFYMKRIGSTSVFYAALIAEAMVIAVYIANIVSFLWLNVIGCLAVMIFTLAIHHFFISKKPSER
jgi:Na+/proline symporter